MKRISIYFSLLILFFMGLSPVYAQLGMVKGNGTVIKENRDVKNFDNIVCRSALNVYLVKGDAENVCVETHEDVIEFVKAEVKGTTLEVYTSRTIRDTKVMNVYITYTQLNGLQASGATSVHSEDKIEADHFMLNTSGASDVRLDLYCKEIICDISGASSVVLKGKAVSMNAELSGASDLSAGSFITESVDVDASGASSAHVYASKDVMMNETGASDISYTGGAQNNKRNGKIVVKVSTDDED